MWYLNIWSIPFLSCGSKINPHKPVAQKVANEVDLTDPPKFFDAHLLGNTNLTLRRPIRKVTLKRPIECTRPFRWKGPLRLSKLQPTFSQVLKTRNWLLNPKFFSEIARNYLIQILILTLRRPMWQSLHIKVFFSSHGSTWSTMWHSLCDIDYVKTMKKISPLHWGVYILGQNNLTPLSHFIRLSHFLRVFKIDENKNFEKQFSWT